jgi:FlaA1/EpsC-like NDP-sugar epimerase
MLIPDYNKVASRWLIFGLELIMAHLAFMCSMLMASQSGLIEATTGEYAVMSALNTLISGVGMLLLRTHVGIIRYSSSKDMLTVMKFGILQFACWLTVHPLVTDSFPDLRWGRTSLWVNSMLSSLFIITARVVIKETFSLGWRMSRERINVLVYGADINGSTTLQALQGDRKVFRNVVAFIDGGKDRIGKSINGHAVIGEDLANIRKTIREKNVQEVILADEYASQQVKNDLLNLCNEHGIRLATLPPLSVWMNGRLGTSRIRDLTIESVLERDTITIDNELTGRELGGSTVLVTGAAGSIGGELCVQLCRHGIRRLVMLDISETGLHDMLRRLSDVGALNTELIIELANIRDKERIESVIGRHRPDFVYHAAAYKHVPILESFPMEAVQTNIIGTRNLADAASGHGVRKFVMISTDKAVNPTNVMGASKRIAELYVNSMESGSGTHFITTRFGNVIGSNGSVVPIFKSQIENGGPVTVTHPDITRFFMTIPEASSLVIEASVMGTGGEIFVFDMGSPVRILDMAKKMIQLAGLRPEVDIKISFSGLRKGEKLHEELFRTDENPLATHHPKIMKARHKTASIDLRVALEELALLSSSSSSDADLVKSAMRRIVPEFCYETSQDSTLNGEKTPTAVPLMDRIPVNGRKMSQRDVSART